MLRSRAPFIIMYLHKINILKYKQLLYIHSYACRLKENSGQGTILAFTDGYVLQVHDDSLVCLCIIYCYV